MFYVVVVATTSQTTLFVCLIFIHVAITMIHHTMMAVVAHIQPRSHPTSSSFLIDPETQTATEVSRKLGLLVIRGTQVSLISPQEGVEEISNPFAVAAEEETTTEE
jgi:hypothetical protein